MECHIRVYYPLVFSILSPSILSPGDILYLYIVGLCPCGCEGQRSDQQEAGGHPTDGVPQVSSPGQHRHRLQSAGGLQYRGAAEVGSGETTSQFQAAAAQYE